jgi:hypothetical protein
MKQLLININELELKRLKQTAQENGKNVSEYLRGLIREDYKKTEDLPHEQLKEMIAVSAKKQANELDLMRSDIKVLFRELLEIKTTVKKSYAIQIANISRSEEFLDDIITPVYPEIAAEAIAIRKKIDQK